MLLTHPASWFGLFVLVVADNNAIWPISNHDSPPPQEVRGISYGRRHFPSPLLLSLWHLRELNHKKKVHQIAKICSLIILSLQSSGSKFFGPTKYKSWSPTESIRLIRWSGESIHENFVVCAHHVLIERYLQPCGSRQDEGTIALESGFRFRPSGGRWRWTSTWSSSMKLPMC